MQIGMSQLMAPTLLGQRGALEACKADTLGHKVTSADAVKSSPPEPSYAARWAQAVEKYGDFDALIFDGVGPELRFSFKDLESDANRLARNLISLGVKAGDRLVTIAENRPEIAILLLSCLKLGAAFIPLATDLRVQDIHCMVDMYKPKVIVCDQAQYAPFAIPDGGERQTLLLPPYRAGENELKRMMAEGDDAHVEVLPVSPDDTAIIFSTSGSTGLPKGVSISFGDIARIGGPLAWGPDLAPEPGPGKRLLMWISMRGVCGVSFLLRELLYGSVTVMVDTYPSTPQLWGDLIDKHRIESHVLFGAAMNQTLQEMPDRLFKSVKNIVYGGSCFAPRLVQRSMGQFPSASFVQGYGMTETFFITTLGAEYHKLAGQASPKEILKMSSAGRPAVLGNVFIEDLDQPGSGNPPPPVKDGVGQICARSAVTMLGYYNNPEKTKDTMPDGKFVRTGDVGRIDEDGFLYILGRVKDIIPAYKGFNVCPRDIEDVLYMHPSVGQAAVVGIWHPSGAGEAVVAWVAPKSGPERLAANDLRRHCEEAGMPSWQMPDAIFVRDQPLPTNGGKIANKTLRTPQFRQEALAEGMVNARERLRGEACWALGSAPARCSEEDEAHVDELFRDVGAWSANQLKVLFGEHLPSALMALRPVDANSEEEEVGKTEVFLLLGAMSTDERAAFVLGALSLLGNWAEDKICSAV